jgi:hypothetical protein
VDDVTIARQRQAVRGMGRGLEQQGAADDTMATPLRMTTMRALAVTISQRAGVIGDRWLPKTAQLSCT